MPRIQLIFNNSQNKHDINFKLTDSSIALKWFKKLKHIYRLPVSDTDSQLVLRPDAKRFDIKTIHENFCRLADINFEQMDYLKQSDLNKLHSIYEQHHDRLVAMDPSCLYEFHQAIHNIELTRSIEKFNSLSFGWAEREGPLMDRINMHQHYCNQLAEGHIYIKWSELGKLPSQYFADGEPNDQTRFNALSKPNQTLRPKFSLQLTVKHFKFTDHFNDWFKSYKKNWLAYHGIDEWRPIDEVGGVLVAEPLDYIKFEDFIIKYPNFDKIILN